MTFHQTPSAAATRGISPGADEKADKLWEMIKHIDVAMMTTFDGDKFRSRPMWCSNDRFDGSLYFFTRRSSPKVAEIMQDEHVGLSFAHPGKQDYVSVSGRGRVVTDRGLMKQLWREPMRTWFPKGIDDADMVLLAVTVEAAEYWDSPSATMVFLYGYVKARLTGEPPNPGEHEKLGNMAEEVPGTPDRRGWNA